MDEQHTLPPQSRDYAIAWVSSLLFFGGFYALLVPLPLYLTGIGLPDWQVGVILGAFGITSLLTRPLAGVVADVWGRRRVMLLGAGSLIAGAVGVGMTTAPLLLAACRILQATGYVAFTTAATALVADLAGPRHRGAALARFGVSVNLAVTVTPAAVSAALRVLTLQGALWLSGGLAAAGGVLSLFLTRAPQAPPRRLTVQSLFRAPGGLWVPMAAAGLFGVGYGAFLQFLPLLTERRGLGPAGLVYTVYGIGIILTRLTTGRLLDRGDRTHLLVPAFLCVASGLVGFALAPSRAVVYAAAVVFAAGSGVLHPALIAIHVESMLPEERGRAAAGFYLGFDLGIGLGAWLLAPVFQRYGLTGLYLMAAVAVAAGILLVRPMAARVRRITPAGIEAPGG